MSIEALTSDIISAYGITEYRLKVTAGLNTYELSIPIRFSGDTTSVSDSLTDLVTFFQNNSEMVNGYNNAEFITGSIYTNNTNNVGDCHLSIQNSYVRIYYYYGSGDPIYKNLTGNFNASVYYGYSVTGNTALSRLKGCKLYGTPSGFIYLNSNQLSIYQARVFYNTETLKLVPSMYNETYANGTILYLLGLADMPLRTASSYTITVTTPVHGTVTADKQEAEESETVTVTVAPEDGYRMIFGTNGTRVTDANDNEIQINLLTPSLFTFEMPDSDVTVTVVFQSGNPYLPGGTSEGESDVPGEFDNRSDEIPVPVTPDINYSDSGLVRLFSPSSSQVISFGNYLWSGTFNFDNIIKAFSNPMDSLISFHKVPFAVETDPAIIVKFGGLTTTVVMPPVKKQLYDLDFGTIVFPKYYGSAFDYSPYSKAKIYLPYIGEIPLNIDRLIGKSIGVQYKCDCYSGTMIAYVTIDGQVYIQQSGSCLLPIPISMNNYQQLVTGGFRLLSGALGGMPQMATGFGSSMQSSVADMALSAVKPASDLLQSAFGKPETASSALGGGIAGYLGVQYPYITITRPKQSLASSFNNMYGYPLNVTDYLQNYVGFVKVSDITLHNTNATTQERDEIYRLLHTGIVIGTGTPPTYSTPEQNMKIVFERFVGRQNSVLKEITTVLECTGSFREYQDITNPKVRIQGEIGNVITNSNMVCIPSLKRRYFIEKVETNTLNSYDITLICDVLESFWDEFKGSLAIIERAEQSYNLNLNDNLFVAEQKPLFQMLKFSSGFTTTSYILALSGNNGA